MEDLKRLVEENYSGEGIEIVSSSDKEATIAFPPTVNDLISFCADLQINGNISDSELTLCDRGMELDVVVGPSNKKSSIRLYTSICAAIIAIVIAVCLHNKDQLLRGVLEL